MKKVLMTCFILFIIVCIEGCNIKKSLKYKVKYYKSESREFLNAFYHTDKLYNDPGYSPMISTLIKSNEELKQLCDKYNSPAFSENSDKYNSELNKLLRSFDSNYFEDKSLIICFGNGPSGGILGKIKNITIEENILMVNYTRKDAEISIASIRQDPWVLIIEVNKKDVKNISQVQLIKK